MAQEDNVIQMHRADAVQPNYSNSQRGTLNSNGTNGGEPPMRNDYVTREEFNQSMERINSKIDLLDAHLDTKFEQVNTKFEQVNTKIEKQKVWFYGTGIAIVGSLIAISKFFF